MILLEIKKQIESLQELISGDIIDQSEGEQKMYMLKEKAVLKKHNRAINQRSDGRFITKMKCGDSLTQKSADSYDELIEKLYDFYYGEANSTLESLYPQWVDFRRNETSLTEKSIEEYGYLWNAHLKDEKIIRIPLCKLKPKDYIVFFRNITKGRAMTRKRFNDMKSIMNGIIYFAIEKEIIDHNYLNDINYNQFSYKADNTDIIPFTESERRKVIDYLDSLDLYDLAIKLMFCLTIRIGELKALRFDDVQGDFIHVCKFVDNKHNIVEHVKGNASAGIRWLPLPDEAKQIINIVKEINPDSEYLFMLDSKNQKFITTSTFNRHLRRCCEVLDITYRSSHKIRFSTASILNINGVSVPEMQKLLGHTNSNTTHRYLKNVASQTETHDKVISIFAS